MQPFISTADLGQQVGRDVTADRLAVIAIDSACETVRSYLDQRLNVATETLVLDGSGADALLLPEMPIRDVDAVKMDDVALADTEFFVDSEGGLLYRPLGSIWTLGRRNVSVTYTHGYDVVEDPGNPTFLRMPSDIRDVALGLAQRVFISSGTITGTKQSETIGPEGVSYSLFPLTAEALGTGLTEADRVRLEPYRKLVVA